MSIGISNESTIVKRICTEPSLNVVHDGNDYLSLALLQQHAESFPQWETSYKNLEEFRVRANNRGSELQHGKVVIPKKLELEQEREKFKTEYWEFMATCETVGQFGLCLLKAIEYLKPRERLIAEEQKLVENAPQLFEQIKAVETFSLSKMSKLKEAHTQVSGLYQRMILLISLDVGWSVQRFCQIVDNEGKPISMLTRAIDNLTYPVIPKPASWNLASAASTEVT